MKTALIGNKQTKASQINVETQQGVVQLSGFVDSEGARKAAVMTAKNVTGVKEVQDKLLLRDGERSTGEAVDDTVIATKVKSELAGKSGLGTASSVTVEVNRGIVELSGFVPTPEAEDGCRQHRSRRRWREGCRKQHRAEAAKLMYVRSVSGRGCASAWHAPLPTASRRDMRTQCSAIR